MATRAEGIALVASGTAAGGDVVADLAIRIHAARSDAGIDALTVAADLGASTLVVVQAAAAMTIGQRVALVARRTRADGSSAHRLLATCTCSAWVA